MHWLIESLRQHPEVTLFLVLALGYSLGNLRIGSFKVGPILGVLIAGIAVGQLNIPVSEALKHTFFMLFLFAIGYQTGPQFFQSLRTTGLRQIVLTFALGLTAFGLSLVMARLSGMDAGSAAGLMAGSMTASPAFGAAGEAIERLQAPDATRQLLLANAAISFAVCYLVGTVLVIWVLKKLGPWILRVDLAAACKELEAEMGGPREDSASSILDGTIVIRTYEVPDFLAGKSVRELEAEFKGYRVFIERLRRAGKIIEPEANEQLRIGDRVALSGRREALIDGANSLSRYEVNDSELLGPGIVTLDLVVSRQMAVPALGELATSELARGIFLRQAVRAGKELPNTLKTLFEPGDVLSLTGEKSRVDRLIRELGYEQTAASATKLSNVAAAIFLGALIGLPALAFRGLEISLTMFVGVLVGGLLLGWLGSHYPKFGGIPVPAIWLFESLGLAGFLALVGMQAGPGFVHGLKQSGLLLLLSAVVVVIVPHIVGMLIGRYLLRLHPGIVLGACAGAGTSSSGLSAVIETARSRVPALSYGLGYALGNVILALGASLIVKVVGPG